MTVKTHAMVIGKTKKPITERNDGGKTSYSLMITARERYYNRSTKKATFEPITVFINLYGKMSDKLKAILETAGVAIVVTGELDKTVARDKDGNPMVHTNEGPRKGDFMYDVRLRGTTSDLNLTPRTDTAPSTTPSEPVASNAGSDESNDGMYV